MNFDQYPVLLAEIVHFNPSPLEAVIFDPSGSRGFLVDGLAARWIVHLKGESSVRELIDRFAEQESFSKSEVEPKMTAFLAKLAEMGLLQWTNDSLK